MPSPEFDQAATTAKQLNDTLGQDELLQLYAYFKQASQNPPFESADKPGMFDLKGKAKYSAWQNVVEKDELSPEQAEEKYMELVQSLKAKHGLDPKKLSG